MDATRALTLTESELDRMGEALVEAERIKEDDVIYRAVCQHMKEKANKISRIADLRDKMANDDLTGKSTHMPNRKEYEG